MREAASLHCNWGARIASGNRIATVQSSEASMAWAQEGRIGGRGWRVANEETRLGALQWGGGASGHGVATAGGTASPRWRGRARRTTTTAEVTTTTGARKRRTRRRSTTGVAEIDDNYNGGDDNYPRVVVEIGAEGREEGRGWNRQK